VAEHPRNVIEAASAAGGRAPLVLAPVVQAESPTSASEPVSAREVHALVEALRDDTVRGNALRALRRLQEADVSALPTLERALFSDDEQQRSLAACAQVRFPEACSPELARVLLGILTPPPGRRFFEASARPWHAGVGRAGVDERWVAFLALQRDARLFLHVQLELEERLRGDDPILRFDAARLVLAHPEARERAEAIRVLVEHLADNHIADDAAISMRYLGKLGREALPAVCAALPGRDEQSARLLAHFLAHVEPTHPSAHRLSPKEISRMGFPAGDMLVPR